MSHNSKIKNINDQVNIIVSGNIIISENLENLLYLTASNIQTNVLNTNIIEGRTSSYDNTNKSLTVPWKLASDSTDTYNLSSDDFKVFVPSGYNSFISLPPASQNPGAQYVIRRLDNVSSTYCFLHSSLYNSYVSEPRFKQAHQFLTARTDLTISNFGGVFDIDGEGRKLAVVAWDTLSPTSLLWSGSVEIFRTSSSGFTREQTVFLSSSYPNNNGNDFFGSISMNGDGNMIAVGNWAAWPNTVPNPLQQTRGAIHVIRSGTNGWYEESLLTGTIGTTSSIRLGDIVAINSGGNVIIASDPWSTIPSTTIDYAGIIYAFRSSSTGWRQEATITGSRSRFPNAYFGSRNESKIYMNNTGDKFSIGHQAGSGSSNIPGHGVAYIFRSASIGGWREERFFTGSNNTLTFENQQFGRDLGMNGDATKIIIGPGGPAVAPVSFGLTGALTNIGAGYVQYIESSSYTLHCFESSSTGWRLAQVIQNKVPMFSTVYGEKLYLNKKGDYFTLHTLDKKSANMEVYGNALQVWNSSSTGWYLQSSTQTYVEETNEFVYYGQGSKINNSGKFVYRNDPAISYETVAVLSDLKIPNGIELIDGKPYLEIKPNESITVISDGTSSWYTI